MFCKVGYPSVEVCFYPTLFLLAKQQSAASDISESPLSMGAGRRRRDEVLEGVEMAVKAFASCFGGVPDTHFRYVAKVLNAARQNFPRGCHDIRKPDFFQKS